MEKILGAAGLPATVLEKIPGIIDTCRECRVWMKPSPDPTPTVEICLVRNDQVEADIMFYKKYMVWHMLDRADRFHNGVQILGKTAEIQQDAMGVCWFKPFGPFKYLVIDGEKESQPQMQLNSCKAIE